MLWYLQVRICCSVMESRDWVSVSRPVFWSLGLVSVSKDFGLGLELFISRICIGYFLWSFAISSSLKTVFKNDHSKYSRSKRSVAKLSLLLCCLRDGENNLLFTPLKIYTEFNKKCACTKETAERNLCNERRVWLRDRCYIVTRRPPGRLHVEKFKQVWTEILCSWERGFYYHRSDSKMVPVSKRSTFHPCDQPTLLLLCSTRRIVER